MFSQGVLLIWLSGLLFALVHSLTASQSWKQWFYQRGCSETGYRLLYSMFSIGTTVAWVYFVHVLPDTPLYATSGGAEIALWALQGIGLMIGVAAFAPIDGMVFLGLKKAEHTDPFVVKGVYRWLRHPMYVGAMLVLLAMPEQTLNGLHLTLVICLYFVLGSRFEERRMLAEHPEYADYQQQVGAFIPNFGGKHARLGSIISRR